MTIASRPLVSFPAVPRAGFAAAVVLALLGGVAHYSAESARLAQNKDPYLVEMQADRLAGIMAMVPKDASMGYLTNLQPGSIAAGSAFNAAQYTLAPRLLAASPSGQWVMGNFSSPQDYAALGQKHGLEVVRDFGNGVVLYRRGAK